MSRKSVYALLGKVLEVPIYPDYIPETEALPAASYFRVGSSANKALENQVDLRRARYQVDILHDAGRIDCDKIADKLRAIDGDITQTDFQVVNIIGDFDMPRTDPNVKIYGVTIEIEVTSRSAVL